MGMIGTDGTVDGRRRWILLDSAMGTVGIAYSPRKGKMSVGESFRCDRFSSFLWLSLLTDKAAEKLQWP